MGNPRSSPHKDRSWQGLRERAEKLFASGERQAEVARQLEVSRQCVHNWYRAWDGQTRPGRGRRPRSNSGRRPKLSTTQLAEVDEALRLGPRQHGFDSDRWNLDRLALVIKRITGVAYHPSSVWRILPAMGWSLRYPLRMRLPGRNLIAR